MRKQPLSLKRSAFVRLLAITFAAVLLFYGIGLYLNFMGVQNVRGGLLDAMEAEAQYIAGELERETTNLQVFLQELASESSLLRYAFAHSALSDYQRVEHMKSIANQLLRIKRVSSLVETASVHLPGVGKTISADDTDGTLSREAWEQFSRYTEILPLHEQEWNHQIHVLYTKWERQKPLFIIALGISPTRLLSRLALMRSSDTAAMLFIREDGSLFAETEGASELNQCFLDGQREYTYQGVSYFMTEAEIPSLNLKLRCFNAMDAVMTPVLRYHLWFLGLTLLAGLLLVVCLLYYRIYILHPLNQIFESVRRAETTGRFMIDHQNEDFDDIYAHFTAMVEKIESLAGRIYEEQFRAQRAELRQLQMQINPHFIFNTLFMVYRMAQADGNEEIARVCLNLSNYYRYITKMPEHDVLLKDEIAHIQQYLEIQKIRFAPRLTVDMDTLPAALENEEIPPLMLQPIVENAFVHGLKEKMSDGHVEIRYQFSDVWYRVTVRDNGGQMDEQTVAELNRQLQCGEMETGSALQNLNRRMELRYGKEYELKLESYQNGLQVSVTFPRKERKTDAIAAGRG